MFRRRRSEFGGKAGRASERRFDLARFCFCICKDRLQQCRYALLHVARRDAATTAPLAEAVVNLAHEYGMQLYRAYGEFLQPWAQWRLGEREGRLAASITPSN